jgi:hypothetical protein
MERCKVSFPISNQHCEDMGGDKCLSMLNAGVPDGSMEHVRETLYQMPTEQLKLINITFTGEGIGDVAKLCKFREYIATTSSLVLKERSKKA